MHGKTTLGTCPDGLLLQVVTRAVFTVVLGPFFNAFSHCVMANVIIIKPSLFSTAVTISFIQDTPFENGDFVVQYDNLGSFTSATCTLPRNRNPQVDCKKFYIARKTSVRKSFLSLDTMEFPSSSQARK